MPSTSGTESQTVLPYSSAEDDSWVGGNVTAEVETTLAAKPDGDEDVHMKDA
jgi:hypothetical protein